jgi:hypothetical protein
VWTDCHRPAPGSYNPLERLDTVRELLFPEPGLTMGRRPMTVAAEPTLIENVRWIKSRVVFASLRLTIDPRDPDVFSWERVQVA